MNDEAQRGPRAPYVVTAVQPRPVSLRARLRGVRAVLRLLVTAADSLVTAVLGVPTIEWCARRVRDAARAAFHPGSADQGVRFARVVVLPRRPGAGDDAAGGAR
jgi:hypothetical protein